MKVLALPCSEHTDSLAVRARLAAKDCAAARDPSEAAIRVNDPRYTFVRLLRKSLAFRISPLRGRLVDGEYRAACQRSLIPVNIGIFLSEIGNSLASPFQRH